MLYKLNEFNLYLKDYYKNNPENKFNFEPVELQRYLLNNFYDNPNACKDFTDDEVLRLYSRLKFISKTYADFKFSEKAKNYTTEQVYQAVENKMIQHLLPVLDGIFTAVEARKAQIHQNNNDKKEVEPEEIPQEVNNNIDKKILETSQEKPKTLIELIDAQDSNNYIANKQNLAFYKQLFRIESDNKTIEKINKTNNNDVVGEPQRLKDLLGDSDIALFVAKYQHKLEHKFADFHLQHTNAKLYRENLIRSERALNLKIIAAGVGAVVAASFSAPILTGALLVASATYGIKKLANSLTRLFKKDEPKITPSSTLLNANNILDISVADFKNLINDKAFTEEIKQNNINNNFDKNQIENNLNKILLQQYSDNKKDFFDFHRDFKLCWQQFNRQFDNTPEQKNKPKQPSL